MRDGKRSTKAYKDLQRRYERRDKLIQMRGGRCEHCKGRFPNFMYDFHHVDPSKKTMTLGMGSLGRRWEVILEEFKNCVVICPCCHRLDHGRMKGWVMNEMLIDGDVLIYKACWAVQQQTDWGDGVVTPSTNLGELYHQIDEIVQSWPYDHVGLVALSDREANFRKDILPSYKANRKGNNKPLGFRQAVDYIIKNYPTKMFKACEADDVLGICATMGHVKNPVIVTIDKDLSQIPVPVYNIDRKTETTLTKEEGYKFFMEQALTGDVVDHYKGCPGVGPKTVEKLFKDREPSDYWDIVVETYEKKGLTEEDALVQARMAYILQADDFNYDTEEITLWTPGI